MSTDIAALLQRKYESVASHHKSHESEYAIANGSGVSQSVVNRFVHGERGISLETAAKLRAYLKLQLRWGIYWVAGGMLPFADAVPL